MPIDASRNPYDSPRFDTGGGKAVRPDAAGKDDLDDDLDDALDDLGAGAKVPVGDDDPGDDADLDLAGTGSKGDVSLDDLGGDEGAKGAGVDGLSSSAGGDDAGDGDGIKGGFDLDDAEADLADSGTGAKGAVFLDEGDDDLDDLGPDVKVLGGEVDDVDLDTAKGDDLDDLDDLGDDGGGGAFGADLGEVPDFGGKDDLADDDSSIFEQKGSILDAVAEEMKGGLDDDPDDVDF